MTLGAIAIPLGALILGCVAMWFAWRLVRTASREDESDETTPTSRNAAMPPSPAANAIGQIGAVAMLGGVCMWLPSLVNVGALWALTVGGVIANLLGLSLLLVSRRLKRRARVE